MFRLVQHRHGVVDLCFHSVHQPRALLHGLLPLVDERYVLIGDARRQSELVHLNGGSQFHNKTFAQGLCFRGRITAFHRSRSSESAGMPGGRHDLTDSVLDILGIGVVMLLGWQMDDVLPAVIVCDSDPVSTDRREIFADSFQELIDCHAEFLVILLGFSSFGCRTVLFHGLLEGCFIGQRKRRLLDIEKRADLLVTDRSVSFLLFFGKGVVFLAGYDPFLVRTVPEGIPVVPYERNASLSGLNAVTAFPSFSERGIEIGLKPAPVAVQGQRKGVESRDGRSGP